MLRQIVTLVLQGQAESVRRRTRQVIVAMAIAFLLTLAFVFLLVSLFLWLSTFYALWLAALIVVAALVACALILWVISQIAGQAQARERSEHQIQAVLDATLASAKKGDAPLATVAAALAIGFALGRGKTK